MTIINDTTVVVFSSEELKTVLESNNSYTYIYFGSNISLKSGIKIASTKANTMDTSKYFCYIYYFKNW